MADDPLRALLAAGKTRAARDEAERRLASNAADGEALLTLAKLHVLEGRVGQAHAELDRAEKSIGPTADALLVRGTLFLSAQDREQARAAFARAHELEPKRPEPAYSLGMLATQESKLADAIGWLEKSVAAAPDNAVYRASLGSALLANGSAAAAEPHLRRAIAIAPHFVTPYLLLADLLAGARAKEAIELLQKGLAANPNHPALTRALGALQAGPLESPTVPSTDELVKRILEYHERQAQDLRVEETATPASQLIAFLRARAIARSGLFPGAPKDGAGALPKLTKAPSVDGLKIEVPRAELVSERAVDDRLRRVARGAAGFRAREQGEPVQPGDEVLLDLFWSIDGGLLPFGVQGGFHTELAPDRFSPGVFDSIVGSAVGSSVRHAVAAGTALPDGSTARASVELVIFVKEARELSVPTTGSPEWLERLDRGASVDEVRASVRAELERELDAGTRIALINAALDAIARKVDVALPDAAIAAIVDALWKVMEKEWLIAYRATDAQLARSHKAWLEHAGLRQEIVRRARIQLAIDALADDKRFTATPAETEAVLATVAPWMPVPVREAIAPIEKNPFRAAEYRGLLRYLATLEKVMASLAKR